MAGKGVKIQNIPISDVFTDSDYVLGVIGGETGLVHRNLLGGTSGVSGINGINGVSGVNGLDGTSGSSGLTGAAGSSGTSGISGSTGLSGSNGSSGISGINGTNGISGINGADGSSGTSGISGVSGSNGISGINGTDGSSGSSGTSGISGVSGSNGISGINGTDGSSGSSGVSGSSGTDGSSGSSGVTPLITPSEESTSPYTIRASDINNFLEINDTGSPFTVYIDYDANAIIPIGSVIWITKKGASNVVIAPIDPVYITINSINNYTSIVSQYGVATLIKVATGLWYLFGDIA